MDNQGIARFSLRVQLRRWIAFVLLTSTLAIVAGWAMGGVFTRPDTKEYLSIARGQTRSVMQPFANRQLGPLVVRGASRLLHISIERAFIAEGVLSLLVLSGITGFLLVRVGVDALTLLGIGGLAFWPILFNGFVLPDVFHAALLSVFLLFLFQRHYFWAALMLLPLYAARESTILVFACLLIAGWGRMRVRDYLAAVAALVAGMSLVKMLVAGSQANREHVNALVYLVGKVPWNFSKNVLGLPLWNNRNDNTCSPLWQFHLHLGGIQSVGVCAYNSGYQISTLRLLLGMFGLLPLVLILLWRRNPRLIWPENLALRFCVLYGGISFLLAPALGASVDRLIGFGWPLFILGVPILALQSLRLSLRTRICLQTLHLLVAWVAVPDVLYGTFATRAGLLILEAAIYAAAWALLKRDATNRASMEV